MSYTLRMYAVYNDDKLLLPIKTIFESEHHLWGELSLDIKSWRTNIDISTPLILPSTARIIVYDGTHYSSHLIKYTTITLEYYEHLMMDQRTYESTPQLDNSIVSEQHHDVTNASEHIDHDFVVLERRIIHDDHQYYSPRRFLLNHNNVEIILNCKCDAGLIDQYNGQWYPYQINSITCYSNRNN